MHDGMPYGRIQGQGQGHEPIQGSSIKNLQSREVDRQSPTGLIFNVLTSVVSSQTANGNCNAEGFLSESEMATCNEKVMSVECRVSG